MVVDLNALANGPHLAGNPDTDLFGVASDPRRTGKRKEPVPSGHVFRPGTGPAGETCGSCEHLFRNELARVYLKCGLNRLNWTGGRKTDVRAGDAACQKWERKS